MVRLCKDKKKAAADAEKAAARRADGKTVFMCKECKRLTHNDDHVCAPQKVKDSKESPA
jgi:hypothetical protein